MKRCSPTEGFFASDDLYEVKKAGEEFNELETGYFVSKDEIGKYHDDEKVYEKTAACVFTVKAALSTAWPGETAKNPPLTTPRKY